MVHHKRYGEHALTVEVRDVVEPSIAEWLNAPRVPSAPELSPAAPLLPVSRRQVTVHRELDDDGQLAVSLLSMERKTQSLADTLVGENDTRLALLLSRSAAAVSRSAQRAAWVEARFAASTFQRRRASITPLVRELGHLLAAGDVDPATAAGVMGLRSRYLSAPDDSQRLPMMTPELLAAMDAERGRVTIHAPGCEYDGCTGCVVMPDEEGGYEVALPGVGHWVHFEASELEFAGAGAA